MRLEWIEDLLAVAEYGSLQKAAEHRFVTQPAFSRRIQAIEQHIGVELIDRSRKPAQVHEHVIALRQRMQAMSAELRSLAVDLRRTRDSNARSVMLVSQHSITASFGPELVARVNATADLQINLRSENFDECMSLLIKRQADIAITYRALDATPSWEEAIIEAVVIGEDELIPVFSGANLDHLKSQYQAGELPAIVYPPEVFMGALMLRRIAPRIQAGVVLRRRTETALTIAAKHLAQTGIGVAWIPRSLAEPDLATGELVDLSDMLPTVRLETQAIRLRPNGREHDSEAWEAITRSPLPVVGIGTEPAPR
jgi:DNA-binding transcriptional LysR family regulator